MYSIRVIDPSDSFGVPPPEKPKSLLAEVGPFLALTVGVPLIIWYAERKKARERFRRVQGF